MIVFTFSKLGLIARSSLPLFSPLPRSWSSPLPRRCWSSPLPTNTWLSPSLPRLSECPRPLRGRLPIFVSFSSLLRMSSIEWGVNLQESHHHQLLAIQGMSPVTTSKTQEKEKTPPPSTRATPPLTHAVVCSPEHGSTRHGQQIYLSCQFLFFSSRLHSYLGI